MSLVALPPALRATAYFARSYRRTWRGSVANSFANPLLYLAAMGVGLGSFVDKGGHNPALHGLSYLQFVAPALAAATAATTSASEATFPVMGAIKWNRTYLAMLATPLRVADVLAGHLAWIAARVAIAVVGYLAVMAGFGAVTSTEAIAIAPVGILVGLAFAAPLAAFAATQENDGALSLVFRLGVIPLFLFSGVFFPVSQLPAWLRYAAYATPLWHGVTLCRALAFGYAGAASVAIHLAYLVALTAAGSALAIRAYSSRLRT